MLLFLLMGHSEKFVAPLPETTSNQELPKSEVEVVPVVETTHR